MPRIEPRYIRFSSRVGAHAESPREAVAPGALGHDMGRTVAEPGHRIHEEAGPRRHIAAAGDTAVVGTAADGNRIRAVNNVVDSGSPGDSQKTGYETIPYETGKRRKHSPRNHNLPELAANSEKEELANWKYSSQPDFHHGPPWSSSLEF